MATAMQYSVISDGIDLGAPLIYMWEIRDYSGSVVGRYVGKAEDGHDRPRRDYKRNVDRLLQGLPYRRSNPEGYRTIHRALAAATRAAHDIVVTYIRNVEPHEDINAVEQHYIRHYNCFVGNGIGLNAVRSQRQCAPSIVAAPEVQTAPVQCTPNPYTLSQISAIIAENFPMLQSTQISKGLAYRIGDTRILRIEQSGPRAKVKIKFALSTRRLQRDVDVPWTDTPETLIARINHELLLYRQYYA